MWIPGRSTTLRDCLESSEALGPSEPLTAKERLPGSGPIQFDVDKFLDNGIDDFLECVSFKTSESQSLQLAFDPNLVLVN